MTDPNRRPCETAVMEMRGGTHVEMSLPPRNGWKRSGCVGSWCVTLG
jgi:hypothetical protein